MNGYMIWTTSHVTGMVLILSGLLAQRASCALHARTGYNWRHNTPRLAPVFPPAQRGEGVDHAPARPRPRCRFARRRCHGSVGSGFRLAASCLTIRWRAYRPQPAALATAWRYGDVPSPPAG